MVGGTKDPHWKDMKKRRQGPMTYEVSRIDDSYYFVVVCNGKIHHKKPIPPLYLSVVQKLFSRIQELYEAKLEDLTAYEIGLCAYLSQIRLKLRDELPEETPPPSWRSRALHDYLMRERGGFLHDNEGREQYLIACRDSDIATYMGDPFGPPIQLRCLLEPSSSTSLPDLMPISSHSLAAASSTTVEPVDGESLADSQGANYAEGSSPDCIDGNALSAEDIMSQTQLIEAGNYGQGGEISSSADVAPVHPVALDQEGLNTNPGDTSSAHVAVQDADASGGLLIAPAIGSSALNSPNPDEGGTLDMDIDGLPQAIEDTQLIDPITAENNSQNDDGDVSRMREDQTDGATIDYRKVLPLSFLKKKLEEAREAIQKEVPRTAKKRKRRTKKKVPTLSTAPQSHTPSSSDLTHRRLPGLKSSESGA